MSNDELIRAQARFARITLSPDTRTGRCRNSDYVKELREWLMSSQDTAPEIGAHGLCKTRRLGQ